VSRGPDRRAGIRSRRRVGARSEVCREPSLRARVGRGSGAQSGGPPKPRGAASPRRRARLRGRRRGSGPGLGRGWSPRPRALRGRGRTGRSARRRSSRREALGPSARDTGNRKRHSGPRAPSPRGPGTLASRPGPLQPFRAPLDLRFAGGLRRSARLRFGGHGFPPACDGHGRTDRDRSRRPRAPPAPPLSGPLPRAALAVPRQDRAALGRAAGPARPRPDRRFPRRRISRDRVGGGLRAVRRRARAAPLRRRDDPALISDLDPRSCPSSVRPIRLRPSPLDVLRGAPRGDRKGSGRRGPDDPVPAGPDAERSVRSLDLAAHWVRGRETLPRYLILGMTNLCNPRCVPCFSWAPLNVTRPLEMRLEESARALAALPSLYSVVLTGGEPPPNRDLPAVTRLLYRRHDATNVTMPT